MHRLMRSEVEKYPATGTADPGEGERTEAAVSGLDCGPPPCWGLVEPETLLPVREVSSSWRGMGMPERSSSLRKIGWTARLAKGIGGADHFLSSSRGQANVSLANLQCEQPHSHSLRGVRSSRLPPDRLGPAPGAEPVWEQVGDSGVERDGAVNGDADDALKLMVRVQSIVEV